MYVYIYIPIIQLSFSCICNALHLFVSIHLLSLFILASLFRLVSFTICMLTYLHVYMYIVEMKAHEEGARKERMMKGTEWMNETIFVLVLVLA